MSGVRRELTVAVALCLLGAAVALIAFGRTWAVVEVAGRAPLPDATVRLTGADLAAGARALALVGLAGVVALPATRRGGRVLAGLVLLAAGLGIVAVCGSVLADLAGAVAGSGLPRGPLSGPSNRDSQVAGTAAPWLCLLGGVVLALAGLLVAVRGRRWAALSSRYEPPVGAAAAAEPGDAATWSALDRGEDPTRPAADRSTGPAT